MRSTPRPSSSTPEDPQARRWRRYVDALPGGQPPPFEAQWATYREIFAHRPPELGPPPAWQPTAEHREASNLGRFMAETGFADYARLHAWSVAEREDFWRRMLARLGIVLARPPERVLDAGAGPHDPRWLPGARLNAADSCFTAPAERTAIIAGAEGSAELTRTTYGELEALVDRVAHGLRGLGLAEGAAVALYMPMTTECVAAYLGAVRAGCPVVSIADSFPPPEVARRLELGGAEAVITVDRFRRGGKSYALYETVCQAAAPRAVVIPEVSGGMAPLRAGDLAWEAFLGGGEPFPSVAAEPEAVTNVLFSSGTTGTPKAIPWTHLTPIKCAMDGCFHQDIHPRDTVAWPTNIGWMMGPWLIYATLVNGATMALYAGAPTGAGFARFVAAAGVTVLGVVPSLVRAWRAGGATVGVDWSGVRLYSSTGEPSNEEDYLWLMSQSGYRAPVIEYCGGTEIGGGYLTGAVVRPASPATFSAPALGLSLVLLDAAGRPVEKGGMGEVFLVPPSVGLSQRLLNADHHQVYYRGCPRGPAGEVLRRHGDEVRRLARGFFKAQGRADDTMNLGGIKVGSAEIERVVDAHPAVYESAAIAVQETGGGADRLVLFVVPKGEVEPRQLRRELQAALAGGLNPLFKIHDLRLAGHLPRTASNKLMRRELRQRDLEPPTSPTDEGP